MCICETVKTLKWYYMCNRTERERERETMSLCEMVETLKWYYLCNTTKRERERERDRERDYVLM